ADVRPLPIHLRGVVHGPEHLEQLVERDSLGVERDLAHLGVTRRVRADLLVRGVLGDAAAVADLGVHDAWDPAEYVFDAPEAARSKRHLLFLHDAPPLESRVSSSDRDRASTS